MELTIFSNIMIFWGDDISLAKFQYRPALPTVYIYIYILYYIVVGVKGKYESVRRHLKDNDSTKTDFYAKKARYDRRKQRVCIVLYSVVFYLRYILHAVLSKKAECYNRKRKKHIIISLTKKI